MFPHALRSLRVYIFLILFASLTIAIVLFSILSIDMVETKVDAISEWSLTNTATLVRSMYDSHLESFFASGLVASRDAAFISHVRTRDLDSLQQELLHLQEVNDIDIVTVVNSKQLVIQGANPIASGTLVRVNGLVDRSFTSGVPILSTEILAAEYLAEEAESIALLSRISKISNVEDTFFKLGTVEDGMAMVAVIPIYEGDQLLGALIMADVLNRDMTFPLRIQEESTGRSPFDFTIFQNDTTITTNILTDSGTPYIGVTMSPAALDSQLFEGEPFYSTVWAKDHWTRGIFLPLEDHRSNVIGALALGVPESSFEQYGFWSVSKEFRGAIFLFALVLVFIAFCFSLLISGMIVEPIHRIIDSVDKAAEGEFDQGVEYSRFEEFNQLIKRYNHLVRYLRKEHEKKKK